MRVEGSYEASYEAGHKASHESSHEASRKKSRGRAAIKLQAASRFQEAKAGTRAQAAIEFLATYGWAILVVTVLIAALAYFGVLNPNVFIPERCILSDGFKCADFVFNSYTGGVVFSLENAAGRDVTISEVSLAGRSSECVLDDSSFQMSAGVDGSSGIFLQSGKRRVVYVPCDRLELTPGKERSQVAIKYQFSAQAGLEHTARGELVAKMSAHPWPTESLCSKAVTNGLCVHMQDLFPPKGSFEGFACECTGLYGGTEASCHLQVAC